MTSQHDADACWWWCREGIVNSCLQPLQSLLAATYWAYALQPSVALQLSWLGGGGHWAVRVDLARDPLPRKLTGRYAKWLQVGCCLCVGCVPACQQQHDTVSMCAFSFDQCSSSGGQLCAPS